VGDRDGLRVVVATRSGDFVSALTASAPAGVEIVPIRTPPVLDDQAEVLVVGGATPAPMSEILRALPGVRWVHSTGAGVERYLVPELMDRDDVILTNSGGAHARPMAEFVMASIYAAAKQLPAYVRNHDQARWPGFNERPSHLRVRGSILLILGPGRIGTELARLAHGVGMRILAIRRRPEPLAEADETGQLKDLSLFARRADFLAITGALTPETRGCVSREVLAALPAHAWVINVARGDVIDEQALREAMTEKRIGGAVLDVVWQEPLPADSVWWRMPNVLVTGHASGGSGWIVPEQVTHFLANLRRYRAFESLANVVDKRAGY
jgi:phosphoglycerate dehydrogenase-like enzyme